MKHILSAFEYGSRRSTRRIDLFKKLLKVISTQHPVVELANGYSSSILYGLYALDGGWLWLLSQERLYVSFLQPHQAQWNMGEYYGAYPDIYCIHLASS